MREGYGGPATKRLHGLDHLRGLAIVLVMLLHYQLVHGLPEPLAASGIGRLAWFGWSGVDLFFVLSGYLIGDKLLSELDRTGRIDLGRFWLGRALRLLPAYLVVVVIYFSYEQMREVRDLAPLWRFLTFTNNLPIDVFTNTFSHAWSLSAEWHFYLVLPVVLLLLARGRRLHRAAWFLLAVIVVGLLARYAAWEELVDPLTGRERRLAVFLYIYCPTYMRLDGFLMGVGIAALFRYRPALRDRITRHGNLLLVAGLLGLGLCSEIYGGRIDRLLAGSAVASTTVFPTVSLAYALLVAAALSPGCVLHRWRSRTTAVLAAWSYSIYLLHTMGFHVAVRRLAPQLGLTAMEAFLAGLAAAVLLGASLHHLVERPFLDLRDRYLGRRSRSPAAGNAAP